MVVVLAAIWAYRRHRRDNKNRGGSDKTFIDTDTKENTYKEGSTRSKNIRKNIRNRLAKSTKPERLAHHLKQAEQFRRSSTKLIHHAKSHALRCNNYDTTFLEETHQESQGKKRPDTNEKMSSDTDKDDHNMPDDRNEIRQEWINAVFGPDYFPDGFDASTYEPPRQGVGLSQIPHYLTYSATIPKAPYLVPEDNKLGITLSGLAVGLYVKRMEPNSEVYAAGVEEGSILVDINGMGMLAEPSKQALERLWQYEGHFSSESSLAVVSAEDNFSSTAAGTRANISSEIHAAMASSSNAHSPTLPNPICLTFIRKGKLYTAVFLSKLPFGISWAPCGNFALVQRSYSFAQAAGVRRGCLVAAVNGVSLRSLDHHGAAKKMKELFDAPQEIIVTLAYTPAPSRSGYFERRQQTNQDRLTLTNNHTESLNRRKLPPTASQEGVEIRVHPLFSWVKGGGDLHAAARNNEYATDSTVSELADQVLAGNVEAPTKRVNQGRPFLLGKDTAALVDTCKATTTITTNSSNNSTNSATIAPVRMQKLYGPIPTLAKEDYLRKWDAMNALSYCFRFKSAGYEEDVFFEQIIQTEKSHRQNDIEVVFQDLLTRDGDDVYQIVEAFLIQCVSIICLPTLENKEELDVATSQSNIIIAFLVELAQRNDDFLHSLYFLFRSFIATMENKKSRKREDTTHNLLSLLQSLDLLRSAQEKLVNHFSPSLLKSSPTTAANGSPRMNGNHSPSTSSLSSSTLPKTVRGSHSDANSDLSSRPSTDDSKSSAHNGLSTMKKKKSKSVLRMFRKKSSKETGSPNYRKLKSPKKYIEPPVPAPIALSASSALHILTIQEDVSMTDLYNNMSFFLDELDGICNTIERSLLKSISQKVADWALQPWSPRKETALANVTNEMRQGLSRTFGDTGDTTGRRLPLANPIESTELLMSVDSNECYVLPSAHFPLLLKFNVNGKPSSPNTPDNKKRTEGKPQQLQQRKNMMNCEEKLYHIRVEIVALRGSLSLNNNSKKQDAQDRAFVVHGAISGIVKESGRSSVSERDPSENHRWDKGSTLEFDTRSTWGAPNTLSLRLSSIDIDNEGYDQVAYTDDETGKSHYASEAGSCWVDLRSMWQRVNGMTNGNRKKQNFATVTYHAKLLSLDDTETFDQHGKLDDYKNTGGLAPVAENLELELRITIENLEFGHAESGFQSQKRMLLYKHDDDIRQEMLAVQFLKTSDCLLKASGLDLKLLTFRCMPVGTKRGFIEWIPGSVPLSDICQSTSADLHGRGEFQKSRQASGADIKYAEDEDDENSVSKIAKAGLKNYESFQNLGHQRKSSTRGSLSNNPIQGFLRSAAYDSEAPYLIQKDVMDTYVKSCAGFCVVTYLLGVGDRHLDNLLLHQTGHFFHCDFSFILGNDPKKYLPMRITEDMVHGMGGKESDNYAKFLSLAGAAFTTLRRHENVRVLLSLVRLMATSALPDVSENQNPEDAFLAMRDRLRLDLNNDKAISFIEGLIEKSISSKIWLAVDAIHSFGKHL